MRSADKHTAAGQGNQPYVPLSVRYGGSREKLGWWLSGRREWLALKLAPWLTPHYDGYRAITFADVPRMVRCLCPRNVETGERMGTHNECRVHSVPNATWQP